MKQTASSPSSCSLRSWRALAMGKKAFWRAGLTPTPAVSARGLLSGEKKFFFADSAPISRAAPAAAASDRVEGTVLDTSGTPLDAPRVEILILLETDAFSGLLSETGAHDIRNSYTGKGGRSRRSYRFAPVIPPLPTAGPVRSRHIHSRYRSGCHGPFSRDAFSGDYLRRNRWGLCSKASKRIARGSNGFRSKWRGSTFRGAGPDDAAGRHVDGNFDRLR